MPIACNFAILFGGVLNCAAPPGTPNIFIAGGDSLDATVSSNQAWVEAFEAAAADKANGTKSSSWSVAWKWSHAFFNSGDFNTMLMGVGESNSDRDAGIIYTSMNNSNYGDSQFINVTRISQVTGERQWFAGPFNSVYNFTMTWSEFNSFDWPTFIDDILYFARLTVIEAMNASTGRSIWELPSLGGFQGYPFVSISKRYLRSTSNRSGAVGMTTYNMSEVFLTAFS